MEEYKIEVVQQSKQDIAMDWTRYLVTLKNGHAFICHRYNNHRTDHVYFSDKTQFEIDDDLLDKIENKIVNL